MRKSPRSLAHPPERVCLHRVLSVPLTLPIHIALVYLLSLHFFPPSQMKLDSVSSRDGTSKRTMGLERQVGISSRLDGYVSFKDTTRSGGQRGVCIRITSAGSKLRLKLMFLLCHLPAPCTSQTFECTMTSFRLCTANPFTCS